MDVHAAVAGVFFALGLGVGLWGGASGAILTRAESIRRRSAWS